MRVLVTGHRGYLGSVLTTVLRHARFEVIGLDVDWFEGCDFGRIRDDVPAFDTDIRDIQYPDLLSFDAVIHLAGLSDDACGNVNSRLTEEINHVAAVQLAENCKRAGVSRFLFASTSAVYGMGGGCEPLNERSAIRPLTPYACSKARAEYGVLALGDRSFSPICLRLGSVYGVSPRLRADVVVNDLVASAVVHDRVVLRTNGAAWRPLVHVEDVARVFVALLIAPRAGVAGEVFNVAPPGENHRIIDIADTVADALPDGRLPVRGLELDDRNYQADGSKLLRTLHRFEYRWRLPVGIRQLFLSMKSAGLTPADWRSSRFRRAMHLRSLQDSNILDPTFRRIHIPSLRIPA